MKQPQKSNMLIWALIALLLFLATGGLRLVSAGIAFLFEVLPLLVLGYIFYFMYTKSKQGTGNGYQTNGGNTHTRFVELLVYILVQIGKTDGQLSATETRVIYGFFQTQMQYIEVDLKWIASLIETGDRTDMSLETLCTEFNQQFPYEAKLLLLELIGQIITADGRLDTTEKKAAESILSFLKIQEKDAYRFRQLYLNPSRSHTAKDETDTHYATLGIKPGASADEIKKAYREACKQHHPDKVHHLGSEFQKVAEEKMQKINAAYKALSQKT
jgi:DnaJ like chaperone protein